MNKTTRKILRYLIKIDKNNLDTDMIVVNDTFYTDLKINYFIFNKHISYLKNSGYLTFYISRSKQGLQTVINLTSKAIDYYQINRNKIIKYLTFNIIVPIIIGVVSSVLTNLFIH